MASSALPTQTTGRLDRIDSLRAFAMSGVILQHCGLMPFGWMGVWLFYAISGFVVTTALLERPTVGSAWQQLGDFYARRAARIWPIYFAYATAAFLIARLASGHFEWSAYASYLLFYNNIADALNFGMFSTPWFNAGHLWTISVEMQFYVVFGLGFFLLPRAKLTKLLFAIWLLAPLIRLGLSLLLSRYGVGGLDAAFGIYTFSAAHFDTFALGALLAIWRANGNLTAAQAKRLLFIGLGVFSVYAASYMAVNMMVQGAQGAGIIKNIISGILFGQYREIFVYTAVGLAALGIVATAIRLHTPWLRLLDIPAVQFVGRISYGGYVYHPLGLLLGHLTMASLGLPHSPFKTIATDIGTFAIALPATILIASLSYFYVERPIIAAASRKLRERQLRLAQG